MGKRFVVVAPDTDCGKTLVTAGLTTVFSQAGVSAMAMKPIQTGSSNGRSEDLDTILSVAEISVSPEIYETLVPYRFACPCSPHLAAELEERTLSVSAIATDALAVSAQYDVLIIETAGGICSPLNNHETNLELAKALDATALIVLPNRLGILSMGLATIRLLEQAHIPIGGIIFTELSEADTELDQMIRRDNVRIISEMTSIPVIAELPLLRDKSGDSLVSFLTNAFLHLTGNLIDD